MPDAFDGVPLWILKATVLALGATLGLCERCDLQVASRQIDCVSRVGVCKM